VLFEKACSHGADERAVEGGVAAGGDADGHELIFVLGLRPANHTPTLPPDPDTHNPKRKRGEKLI
jgi:hypothetical protein